jgi:DNA repair protein RadA/Sms
MFWPVAPLDGEYIFEANDAPFLNPDEIEITQSEDKSRKKQELREGNPCFNIIPEGSRNQTLFKMACSLWEQGFAEAALRAAIYKMNEEQCIPQLDSDEVETILNSALTRYKPGALRIATSAKSDFSTPPARGKVICLEDVQAEAVNWLWFPYIPLGKLTLMQGDPGDGKTTVVLNIAASISTGRALPGAGPMEPGNIIYQTAEDGIADTIKPRLISAVADCKRVFIIDESEKGLSLSDERIEAAMIELKPKLFIIDPLQAYLGADVDFHRANEVRPVLKKIGLLAEKYACAVILIMHLSKSSQNRSLYRGLGSVDIPAAARSVLLVGKNPNNPQERAMAQVKNSLAPMGQSLGFEITQFGVMWKGTSDLTAEDLLGPAYKSDSNDEEKKSPVLEARKYLIDCLKDGPRLGKEIIDGIKYSGFSKRTLETAKAQLQIKNTWKGRECYWSFPPDQEFPPDTKDEP